MAKTFKPKEKKTTAVQWTGDNEQEFREMLPDGNATKRGRSLVVSSKFATILLNPNEWLTYDGEKLKGYSDEQFKKDFQEENPESL